MKYLHVRFVLVLLTVSLVLGCGSSKQPSMGMAKSSSVNKDRRADGDRAEQAAPAAEAKEARAKGQPDDGKPVPRKIIYTANVDLVVEQFEESEKQLKEVLKEHKSYVSSSDLSGSPGMPRSGSWTVRVPVEEFDAFMEDIVKLGELQRRKLESEDITDKYFDLQATIKNDKAIETDLHKLMEKATGKPEFDSLRRDLWEVRGKIDRQQGQLQRWGKLSELATVTIALHERKGYVPPASPNFGTTVSRTFQGSLDALVAFGQGLVIFAVALTPWLPVLAVTVLTFWMLMRRVLRRPARPLMTVVAVDPPAASPG